MGITGKSALSFLEKHCKSVFFWDDKAHNNDPRLVHPDLATWETIDYCVLSPGIPLYSLEPRHKAVILARKNRVPIVSDIEIFLKISHEEHIGITGTVGKSSCTSFLEQFTKNTGKTSLACGNFGNPVFDAYGTTQAPIIEISSAQLDMTHTKNLDVAVMTSLFADHIAFHGGFENYLSAKHRIITLLKETGLFLCCIDYIEPHHIPKHPNTLTLSAQHPEQADIVCAEDLIHNKKTGLRIAYSMPKKHAHEAFLPIFIGVAVAVCEHFHIKQDRIKSALTKTLENYKTLEHRCEFVCTKGNITFINDSKATNFLAAAYAIKQFSHVLWICGGRPKSALKRDPNLQAVLQNVDHAFIIGTHQDDFYQTLSEDVTCSKQNCLETAFQSACTFAQKRPNQHFTVLLSPAATSFDQFANFMERGSVFKNAAKRYCV